MHAPVTTCDYDDEEEITLQMIKNLIETFESIAREQEKMDDLMLDDEEK